MVHRTRIWLAAVFAITLPVMASELTQFSRSETQVRFNLNCERYAEYLIESSTNLTNWSAFYRSTTPSSRRAFYFTGTNNPSAPQLFFRAVQTTNLCRPAILTREAIMLGSTNGGALVDSFDSSDPAYSTGGQYDPSKRRDRAFVATLSTTNPAIDSNLGHLYGYAACAAGGTITGNIGDGAWQATTTGIQPNHAWDDFSAPMPDVTLPTTTWAVPIFIGGIYVIGDGDYKIAAAFVTKMKVFGRGRVWITGDIRMAGGDEITIQPNASLELYIDGDARIGGAGLINGTGKAASCKIFGLPTCTEITFAGNTAIAAVVYAPNADVLLGGTPDFYGALTALSVRMASGSGFHYDEALGH